MTKARTLADNFAADINGITAGTGITGGGTSGTVTVTNEMATVIDAKGDLVGGTGADAFARLAVGANGTVLTADSVETTGLKWATPTSWAGTYTAYTPVVIQGTTTFTINSGSAYTENGKFVHVLVYFNVASGTGETDRAIEISLPVTAAGDYTTTGGCRLIDASTSRRYYGVSSMQGNTTKFSLVSGANQIDGRWGRTDSQFAIQMAVDDEVFASFVYRKA